jgi:integrase
MSVERTPSGKYKVRWRDESGRPRSRNFTRKADADAHDLKVKVAKQTGGVVDASRQTLREFGEEWWQLYATANLAPRTLRSYSGLWDRHVLPRLGRYRLRDISTEAVARFAADLRPDDVGEPTINRALMLLQGVLQRAVEWRRLPSNPVRGVKKPTIRRRRRVRPLAPTLVEQARRWLLARERIRDATLLVILAYGGLRPSEALALRWGQVRDRTLLIDEATAGVRDDEGESASKQTKNRRVRTVPLMAPLVADLAAYRLACGRPGDDELLFPTVGGEMWTDGHWQTLHRDTWAPLKKAVTALVGSRPYDLRHSYVSLLIHEGLPITEVARRAGHTPTTCLEVYGHVFDEFDYVDRKDAETVVRAAREQAGVSSEWPGREATG